MKINNVKFLLTNFVLGDKRKVNEIYIVPYLRNKYSVAPYKRNKIEIYYKTYEIFLYQGYFGSKVAKLKVSPKQVLSCIITIEYISNFNERCNKLIVQGKLKIFFAYKILQAS